MGSMIQSAGPTASMIVYIESHYGLHLIIRYLELLVYVVVVYVPGSTTSVVETGSVRSRCS
jgi:hypothetical protein